MQNDMRDRLIELMTESDICFTCHPVEKYVEEEKQKLADYLLEHGVIVPPCKVGDIVYVPYKDSQTIEEKRVKSISHVINEFANSMEFNCKHNYAFLYTDINREVFLTREEAEKALKERVDNV